MQSKPTRNSYALCGFSVRRTPRACHGACDRLRPGRLRASHAVCLRCLTLEPALCARKETADNESLSTVGRIRNQHFAMRFLNPSFKTDSLHSSSASSTRIPTTFPSKLRSEVTANNALQRTAPARHTGCSHRLRPQPPFRSRCAAPPQSLSLGSFAVRMPTV